MKLTLNIPEKMARELEGVAGSTGFKDTDLVRHFIGAGLDAIRRDGGVTALARWADDEAVPEPVMNGGGSGGPAQKAA